MIKIATVCSGIGSPEQALKNLNVPHEITFACEIDKYARQTYQANFTPNHMYTDMTKEQWDKPEQYSDLFIGGIPCQAFSLAGKRMGELDPRGLLFFDFYRYVKNQQPKIFIIENVKGLLSDNGGKTFQNWIHLLGQSMNQQKFLFNHDDSLMYNLHFEVLNSKDFGVPQNRERVFLVGVRNDLPNDFRFPIGWRLDKRLKDILEPVVDEKYYLSEKMVEGFISQSGAQKIGYINQDTQASAVFADDNISPTVCAGTHGYAMGYIQEVGKLNSSQDGRVFSADGISQCLSSGHNNSPKIIDPYIKQRGHGFNNGGDHYLAPTITGKSWKDNNVLVEEVIQLNPSKESGGKQPYQQNRVYADYGLMTTMDTESGRKSILTENRIRRLTPLECFRLQGYPDSYIKPCSDSQTYKQAGNSITVSVMQAIINNLLAVLSSEKQKAA